MYQTVNQFKKRYQYKFSMIREQRERERERELAMNARRKQIYGRNILTND